MEVYGMAVVSLPQTWDLESVGALLDQVGPEGLAQMLMFAHQLEHASVPSARWWQPLRRRRTREQHRGICADFKRRRVLCVSVLKAREVDGGQ